MLHTPCFYKDCLFWLELFLLPKTQPKCHFLLKLVLVITPPPPLPYRIKISSLESHSTVSTPPLQLITLNRCCLYMDHYTVNSSRTRAQYLVVSQELLARILIEFSKDQTQNIVVLDTLEFSCILS